MALKIYLLLDVSNLLHPLVLPLHHQLVILSSEVLLEEIVVICLVAGHALRLLELYDLSVILVHKGFVLSKSLADVMLLELVIEHDDQICLESLERF